MLNTCKLAYIRLEISNLKSISTGIHVATVLLK